MCNELIDNPAVHAIDQNGNHPQPARKANVTRRAPRVPQKHANSYKKGRVIRIPQPQQERILTRHVLGQSVRMIAREENRDWKTVANVILKSSDKLKEYLAEQRSRIFALTSEAVEAIHKGLVNGQTDLAYKLLIDTGVMPQQAAAGVAVAPEQLSQDELTEKELGKVIQMAIQRARDYDLPSDSIQMRAPKNEIVVAEESS
jgi:hypothetical protein